MESDRIHNRDKVKARAAAFRFKKPVDAPYKIFFFALYFIGAIVVKCFQSEIAAFMTQYNMMPFFVKDADEVIWPFYMVFVGILLSIRLAIPFGREKVRAQLKSIGFINHVGASPTLYCKRKDITSSHVVIWEFISMGIPLHEWDRRKNDIEAALNISILLIKTRYGKRHVLVYAVPATNDLAEWLPWKRSFLQEKKSVFALGEGYAGQITIDVAKIPHILLGGSTGSGKTVLLKSILMQALVKNYVVCVADFKGGVDYPEAWQRRCRMCYEKSDLLEILSYLVSEIERRKELLRNAGSPNIDHFCNSTGRMLQRYIFACDEAAELLDKTGLSKETKAVTEQIEAKLSVIARQGRAFGIHLILATQRPDATIISGQIRNNIACRICGRADSVLSQIILDSSDAAEQIPKDATGRFLLYDGTVFQSYFFDDSTLDEEVFGDRG